ncbi:unannotated protein [freshwater metagenome]|uniref:Unannotated protein n=1 Tax=freshwater metagenome TaxID=449393 RepID=A0A6J6B2R1_9ZZZZ
MSVLIVAIAVPVVRSLAGKLKILFTDVGEFVPLTRYRLPSSVLRAVALPALPIVSNTTDAVGGVVSTIIALFAPSEPAAPGAGSVNVASSAVAFLIVPPLSAREVVAL